MVYKGAIVFLVKTIFYISAVWRTSPCQTSYHSKKTQIEPTDIVIKIKFLKLNLPLKLQFAAVVAAGPQS